MARRNGGRAACFIIPGLIRDRQGAAWTADSVRAHALFQSSADVVVATGVAAGADVAVAGITATGAVGASCAVGTTVAPAGMT